MREKILFTLFLLDDYLPTTVLQLLDENNAKLRVAAIEAVGGTRSSQVANKLADLLSNSESVDEMCACANSLVRLADKRSATAIAEKIAKLPRNNSTARARSSLFLALQSLDAIQYLDVFKAELRHTNSAILRWILVLGVVAAATPEECGLIRDEVIRYLAEPTGEIRLLTGHAKVPFRNSFQACMSFLKNNCIHEYSKLRHSPLISDLPSFDLEFLAQLDQSMPPAG